jgi:hypothetical protein
MEFKNIELKKFNGKSAIDKDGNIGKIFYWGWKGTLYFGNEKGDIVDYKDASELEIISDQKYKTLYNKRNFKGESGREKTYGVIHDKILHSVLFQTSSKNCFWTKKFGGDYGMMIAAIGIHKDLIKKFGHTNKDLLDVVERKQYSDIATSHLIGGGHSDKEKCTYLKGVYKVRNEEITIEEIKKSCIEYRKLPLDFKTFSMDSQEITYYLQDSL